LEEKKAAAAFRFEGAETQQEAKSDWLRELPLGGETWPRGIEKKEKFNFPL
jgi:hypothetical protein